MAVNFDQQLIRKGNPLAKPNFQFEKRQKELAKKKKKEEKKQRKLEDKNPASPDQPGQPAGEEITE